MRFFHHYQISTHDIVVKTLSSICVYILSLSNLHWKFGNAIRRVNIECLIIFVSLAEWRINLLTYLGRHRFKFFESTAMVVTTMVR
jgi:cation transport ATPase